MPTTTIQPLPYPVPGDAPDVPRDIKALAEDVQGRLVMRFATTAARDAALPSGTVVDGMMCHVAADGGIYTRSGGQWRLLWRYWDWAPVTVAAGITVASPVQVMREGNDVRWRGEVSAAWTTANTTVVAAGVIPDWARPRFTYRDTGSALGSGNAVAAVGTVGTDGALSIRALSAASGAVYLKGLSGYEGA